MPERHPETLSAIDATSGVMAHGWLVRRYWSFSCGVVLMAAPLALATGGKADLVGIGAYLLLTAGAYALDRGWRRGLGVSVHLVALVPYWAWYVALEGGVPDRFARGAPGFVAMLMFPILAITSFASLRGVVAIAACSFAVVFHRFGWTADAWVGAFMVGIALLIGHVFRLPVRNLEEAFQALERSASRDPLTQLPNRRGFDAAFGRTVDVPSGRGFVLLVDLVRFRAINDGFGHGVGDALLEAVAKRLHGEVGAVTECTATLARVDGDEFAVTSFDGTLEEGTRLAARLVGVVAEAFQVKAHVLHLEAHVGIACLEAQRDPAVLLSRARQALYAARATEQRTSVFTEERASLNHIELDLRRALERGELTAYFQPVCDLGTAAVVGVEALVRWNHPTKGVLLPAAFIGPAEACGLMTEIDRVVLRLAVEQVDRWVEAGREVWVAVNLSARTLEDDDLAQRIAALLEEHPAARGRLVVEITESSAMRNPEPCAALLETLRTQGVLSALDDFGMGYSSLAYLKRLPASHLKLDRMFVSGIGQSVRDEGVIELLLDLARKFDMEVIAEGIETPEQLEWLRARSCRFAQGYLLGMPAPAQHLEAAAERASGVFSIRPSAITSTTPPERPSGTDPIPV